MFENIPILFLNIYDCLAYTENSLISLRVLKEYIIQCWWTIPISVLYSSFAYSQRSFKDTAFEADETAQQIKALSVKLYNLSWIPALHMVEGEN